jgi:hypothetical protein
MADTLATASTTCDELLIGNTLEGFCLAHVVCPPTASSGCVFVAVGSFQAKSVTGVVGGTVRTQFPYVGYSAECGLGAGDALLSLRTYCTATSPPYYVNKEPGESGNAQCFSRGIGVVSIRTVCTGVMSSATAG